MLTSEVLRGGYYVYRLVLKKHITQCAFGEHVCIAARACL
jgi:hypothetical protein